MIPACNKYIFFICSLITLVSCKKEEDKPLTIFDIDGNIYNTVTIGGQTWLSENLRVKHYRNGDSIGTTYPANKDVSSEINPKYQWVYNGNEKYAATYGRLYTWYAATDDRCLCPEGWHVPSDSEWTVMENYLIANGFNYDGSNEGNKIAKTLATDTGWTSSIRTGAIGNIDYAGYRNISGFSAQPGGFHYRYGAFDYLRTIGFYWSSTEKNYGGWHRLFYYNNAYVTRGDYGKLYGFSVRCVKD
jgi:uncharacterized protein (TIGR02145 family)